MIEWIIRYWLAWAFGIMATFLGYMWKKIRAWKNEQESLKLGLQALLRNAIISQYNRYMELEYIPIYAPENIELMYEQYHNLGGNGTITKLVDDLHALTSKQKEDESNER